MVGPFARGTFWNKRGAAIDVWRMVRRRFAKITVSSQKLRQLRRRGGKVAYVASVSVQVPPESWDPRGKRGRGGKEKLVKQARETDAGKRESSYNRKKAEIGRKRTKGN